MNETLQAEYLKQLKDMLIDLNTTDDLGRQAQETVMLDQQAVGRLSRMDALQQQAMAKATQQRRIQLKTRIQAALVRIKEDEFGYCNECGDDIPVKRLDLDPTVLTCVSCAKSG